MVMEQTRVLDLPARVKRRLHHTATTSLGSMFSPYRLCRASVK